jgi:hypothetical protein
VHHRTQAIELILDGQSSCKPALMPGLWDRFRVEMYIEETSLVGQKHKWGRHANHVSST